MFHFQSHLSDYPSTTCFHCLTLLLNTPVAVYEINSLSDFTSFSYLSLNTLYFSQSSIQSYYSAHHFLNTFIVFLPPEIRPEAFMRTWTMAGPVLQNKRTNKNKNSLILSIFCFVKSSQNLMGEKTHTNSFQENVRK